MGIIADGDGLIVAGTLTRVPGEGWDGWGTAMRINSDTVTNLKPFAWS